MKYASTSSTCSSVCRLTNSATKTSDVICRLSLRTLVKDRSRNTMYATRQFLLPPPVEITQYIYIFATRCFCQILFVFENFWLNLLKYNQDVSLVDDYTRFKDIIIVLSRLRRIVTFLPCIHFLISLLNTCDSHNESAVTTQWHMAIGDINAISSFCRGTIST